jgi:HD-like signal output (HDOD) protein
MPAYLTECPRCSSPVGPGSGVCERCQATFDPWVERPPKIAALLGTDAESIERSLDFPTVARHLTEVNRLVDRHETSVQDLVAVIVRDLALTTRLLRLVNGPAYRQYNEPVATVTRAVILLGFEQVRRVALSLILYQRLRDHPRGGPLAAQAVLSFGAGLFARAFVQSQDARASDGGSRADDSLPDEAFVCAMYHRLGDLALEAYLPLDADEVAALRLLPDPLPVPDLQLKVVGCTAAQLGAAVARVFGLPHSIIWALRPAPSAPPKPPKGRSARLHLLAAFANAVLQTAVDPHGQLDAVVDLYGEALETGAAQIRSLLVMVAGQIRHHAADLGLGADEHPLVRHLLAFAGPDGSEFPAGAPDTAAGVDARTERLEDARRKAFLSQGRAELEAAVRQGAPIHELLSLAVETLYRGFGFTHAALCLREVFRTSPADSQPAPHMVARIAFGPDAVKMRRHLRFALERSGDVFALAGLDGQDIVVDNVAAPANRQHRVPLWYTRHFAARGFVLFPVRIQGRAVGMLYGDADDPVRCFQRNRFVFLREMRDLIEGALERHRRTLPG